MMMRRGLAIAGRPAIGGDRGQTTFYSFSIFQLIAFRARSL